MSESGKVFNSFDAEKRLKSEANMAAVRKGFFRASAKHPNSVTDAGKDKVCTFMVSMRRTMRNERLNKIIKNVWRSRGKLVSMGNLAQVSAIKCSGQLILRMLSASVPMEKFCRQT